HPMSFVQRREVPQTVLGGFAGNRFIAAQNNLVSFAASADQICTIKEFWYAISLTLPACLPTPKYGAKCVGPASASALKSKAGAPIRATVRSALGIACTSG